MYVQTLILRTNLLEAQRHFYTNILNLSLLESDNTSFKIKIGTSILFFKQDEQAYTYHLAFNIPSFQEQNAYDWLAQRVEIQAYQQEQIVTFEDWNARSIYFYDPAGNILELIARRNLAIPNVPTFDALALLNISEVGWVSEDLAQNFAQLQQQCGIQLYDGNLERFCAAGDEHGLFIMIRPSVKKWLPNNDSAQPSPFELFFEHQHQPFHLIYENLETRIYPCPTQ